MSWFWSSGGSILTQIKKNAGRKINTTPRKIQSPVFSSPVNQRNPRSSAFCIYQFYHDIMMLYISVRDHARKLKFSSYVDLPSINKMFQYRYA